MSGEALSAEKEIEREILLYERNVNEALRKLYRRTGYEPTADGTPLYALMEAEEGGLEEFSIRADTVRRMLAYFAADGLHPASILKRVFAIGSHMMIEPYSLLNLREKGMMLRDSHGAQHWRMKRLCTDPLRRKGAKSIKAPGQKGALASAAAAKAQQGNSNRRGRDAAPREPERRQQAKAISKTKIKSKTK